MDFKLQYTQSLVSRAIDGAILLTLFRGRYELAQRPRGAQL